MIDDALTSAPVLTRTSDPDGHDVARAAAGDTQAFERIYARHAPRLYRVARRLVGNELAEDALQDVFVHTWSRLSQFRGDAQFGTWLHRLAINILLRQATTTRRMAARLSDGNVERIYTSGPHHASRIDVSTALARLSEELRAVVVLHDMEGHTHEGIADLLGISISASKMRLHRARMQLREWLPR
jgi:RNA polymerase sigma factor (sigma-70 family)